MRAPPSASVGAEKLPATMPAISPPRILSRRTGAPTATRSISIANAGTSVPSMLATIGSRRITPSSPSSGEADSSP